MDKYAVLFLIFDFIALTGAFLVGVSFAFNLETRMEAKGKDLNLQRWNLERLKPWGMHLIAALAYIVGIVIGLLFNWNR